MRRASWRLWWLLTGLICGVASCAYGQGRCKRITVEGEVVAGRGFEREIGGGLTIGLDPVASGWVVRVVPTRGVRGEHDYAEVATPPYRSVNPLLVTTEFGFRAQDVVGWNPRRFRYAASSAEFAALLRVYEQVMISKTTEPQEKLARMVSMAAEGTMQILDARLAPGVGDQVPAAGAVATHFATTAHTIEQSAGEEDRALGKVRELRFRFLLDLPPRFVPAPDLAVQSVACPTR